VVFKQEVQGLPDRQGKALEGVEILQEASENLQVQLLAE
jgi:hypothetical protein